MFCIFRTYTLKRKDISFIIEMMMMKNIEFANYDYAIESNA